MVSVTEQTDLITTSDVLKAVFPGTDLGSSGNVTELPMLVIPLGPEPRWMVFGDSRAAVPVFESWRPLKISTRLRWSGVLTACSFGKLGKLPGVESGRVPVDLSYWRKILPGFRDDWVPVLHVGNRSYTRKVTVCFVARDRRCKAVAKVPLVPGAAKAILNEAHVLGQLAGAPYLPQSLFEDPARGIAVQSWLDGKPVSRRLTSSHMELLGRLAAPGAFVKVSDRRSPVAADFERLDMPFDRAVLARALDMLDYDEPLPAFVEHRDFTPWNLRRLPDGQSGAIDWEWAVLRSLPCQDIFRFFYNQDALFDGPGRVWDMVNRHELVRAHYRRFDIPPAALPALAMHYLLSALSVEWGSDNTRLANYAFRQIDAMVGMFGRTAKADMPGLIPMS
jgi:hypothetical protein